MCGLVGVAGRITKTESAIFEEMLYCDALRGMDATGVARVNGQSIMMLKHSLPAYDFMGLKQFDNIVSAGCDVLIGHNRSATVGDKRDKNNAHPFHHGDIVGAHNGTLPYGAKAKLPRHADFGTDSEAIFFNIDDIGIEETIEKIWGAWALTYYDKRDKTINFIRNDQRPLYFTFSKDKKTLLWSSELGLLVWVTSRRGYEIEKPRLLGENKLKYWTIPNYGDEFGEPAEQMIRGGVEPKAVVSVPSGRPYGSHYEAWDARPSTQTTTPEKKPPSYYDGVEFTSKELIEVMSKYDINDPQSDWWSDPKLASMIIEFEDDNKKDPWAWTPGEDAADWASKILALAKAGFEYGDPKARIEPVTPVNLRDDLDYRNFLSKTADSIWNVALNKAQSLPPNVKRDKIKECVWSVKHQMWVFNKALVNYELTQEQKDHYLQFGVFVKAEKKTIASQSVLPFKLTHRPPYKNPATRAQMTKSEFNIITNRGCDWCSTNIQWGDAVKFASIAGAVECFCDDCAGSEEVQQYMRS